MREVVVSSFKSLRTVNLTSMTKIAAECRKCGKHGTGSIIGLRFVPNARRTIIEIKYTVPFFHNKCPMFDKKRRNLICTPYIYI